MRTLAPQKQLRTRISTTIVLSGLIAILGCLPTFFAPSPAAAACQMPAPDYGSVNTTVSIPATATYRIWTRMKVPDTTNKSYMLEVDGNQCYTVGNGTIPTGTWTWIDYQNGDTASKIDLSLSQGSHTIRLIGNVPNVQIDRMVMASDLTCTPTGTGDNCNTPSDTTAPSVSLTAPAQNSTVSGTVTVTANASDNVGVSKVEFYDNSNLISSDNSTPYTASWNTTGVTNGTHTLTAKAYDAADNSATNGYTVNVQNSGTSTLIHPDGSLIRPQNGTAIYLVVGSQRQQIGSPGVFTSQGFDPNKVLPALPADLNLPKTSSDVYFREGVLLKGSGAAVYVIDYNSGSPRKRHITSPSVMSGLGQRRYIGLPQIFDSQQFRGIKKGTTADNNLTKGNNVYFREGAMIKDNNPAVYVVDDNGGTFEKRHITSPNVFLNLGWSTVQNDVYTIPTDAIPPADGSPLQ